MLFIGSHFTERKQHFCFVAMKGLSPGCHFTPPAITFFPHPRTNTGRSRTSELAAYWRRTSTHQSVAWQQPSSILMAWSSGRALKTLKFLFGIWRSRAMWPTSQVTSAKLPPFRSLKTATIWLQLLPIRAWSFGICGSWRTSRRFSSRMATKSRTCASIKAEHIWRLQEPTSGEKSITRQAGMFTNELKYFRVYLCKQWSELKVFNDHTATATGVRFGRHAQWLASTSMDRTLKLYGIE